MTQMARVVLGGKVISEEPYTPASDYIRACIAAGLCTRCDGKSVTEYWLGTEEHLKCDTCGRRWFRGHPHRQEALFDAPSPQTMLKNIKTPDVSADQKDAS